MGEPCCVQQLAYELILGAAMGRARNVSQSQCFDDPENDRCSSFVSSPTLTAPASGVSCCQSQGNLQVSMYVPILPD